MVFQVLTNLLGLLWSLYNLQVHFSLLTMHRALQEKKEKHMLSVLLFSINAFYLILCIFIDKNPLNATHSIFSNTVETERHGNSASVNGLPVQGQDTFLLCCF